MRLSALSYFKSLTENSREPQHTTRHSREKRESTAEIGVPALDPCFRRGDHERSVILIPFSVIYTKRDIEFPVKSEL
jgi:hypothetical protein